VSKPRKISNQELRTRKDLLLAASRLLKQGRKPSMDEVAAEALVSRATAYRCFKSVDALVAEAPVEDATAPLETLFTHHRSTDPEVRIDEAEAALHEVVFRNEAQLRLMLSHTVAQGVDKDAGGGGPKRQNRRGPLIAAALEPARGRFRDKDYQRLCAALALIFGTESMIVFRDVLNLDEKTARQVKSWAVRALVRAALKPA
jgi:AcrR family transcriptional regulator